jgi:type III restriction enzyme
LAFRARTSTRPRAVQFVTLLLDASSEVVVYAKLPCRFIIPSPVGDHNPDWANAFQEGKVKHIYFVAETKGSLTTMHLRRFEESRLSAPASSSVR